MSLSNNQFFYVNSNYSDTSNVLSNYMNLTHNTNNTLNIQENPLSKYARGLFFSPNYNKQFFDVLNWANNLGIYKNQTLILNPLINNVLMNQALGGSSSIVFSGGIFETGAFNNYYTVTTQSFNPFTYSTIPVSAIEGSTQLALNINNIEFRNALAGDTVVPITDVLNVGNVSANIKQIGGDIDGEAVSDHSGRCVAMNSDGTILAIGAIGNDGNGNNSGHVRVYQWQTIDTNGATDVDFTAHTQNEDPALFTINNMQTDMEFELTFRLTGFTGNVGTYIFMHFYNSNVGATDARWSPSISMNRSGILSVYTGEDNIYLQTSTVDLITDYMNKVVTLRFVQTATAKTLYLNGVVVANATGSFSYTGAREVGLRDGSGEGNHPTYNAPNAGSMDVLALK